MNETFNATLALATNQTADALPTILGSTVPLTFSPVLDIFLIALVGSLFVTLINKYLGDQTRIRALKEEMKGLRKKSREVMMKDPKKAQQIQQEMMKKSMENMKLTMNPRIMLTTMLPMLLLLGLVRNLYAPLGDFWDLGFTTFSWLGTYIVASLIWSILLKKVLNVA